MNRTERKAAKKYNNGNSFLREKQYLAAITAYNQTISLVPGFGPAYYNRALAREYSGDLEGCLEDFRMAAINGFEEGYFHEAWMNYLRKARGYRGVLAVCEDLTIPVQQRSALESVLYTALQEQSFLLREWPEAGVRFNPDSFPLLCLLGDLIRNRFEPDDLLLEKLMTISKDKQISDLAIAWRLHYLLGIIYASTYLKTFESIEGSIGLFFDADYVDDHAFVISRDSDTGDRLDRLLQYHYPRWQAIEQTERFARFALIQFEVAVSKLCANRRLFLTPAKAASLHWDITQDLWRAYVETTIYLKNFHAYSQALASVRFYNALVGLKGWSGELPVQSGVQADRIQQFFNTPDSQSNLLAPESQLILDYFVFEKASDTIVCGVYGQRYKDLMTIPLHPDMVSYLAEVSNQRNNANGQHMKFYSEPRGVDLSIWDFNLKSNNQILDELDTTLIGPVKELLSKQSRLVVAPFGYLYNVPFHLLPSIRELINRGLLHEITYITNTISMTTVLERIPVERRNARYLFVGGGESISFNKELTMANELFFQVTSLTEERANRAAVLEALQRTDIVHFACHGGFDYERNCAYLQLPQERLYPGDLLSVNELELDLVLLNACVTGVFHREARNGDAAIGLPSAFQLAGARQVIGSLWPIDDAAAVAFATHFFQTWYRNTDMSSAATVLHTQLAMSRMAGFEDAYYWGAYAMFGDWR